MPKSYKICPVEKFDFGNFSDRPYNLRRQLNIANVPPPPETLIRRSSDSIAVDDFRSFLIEHERIMTQRGRLNDQRFTEFIRTGEILAHYSKNLELLLLCGKKDDILDFCRTAPESTEIKFSTITIDMKALLAKLQDVHLAWFRYDDSIIHASALAGQHIETTKPFKDANAFGVISTLSFYFEDKSGLAHPILVTSDGAVVLQANYEERATEVELVLLIKSTLLDGIYTTIALRRRAGGFS